MDLNRIRFDVGVGDGMGLDITGLGSVFDFGSKIIDKIWPDKDKADAAKLELAKMQQSGELQQMATEANLMTKQADTNIEEAKSSNFFVAGWRPSVGWVCSSGLLYSVLLQPILVACGVKAPITDTAVLLQLLFAMLGIGYLRTKEKVAGVAR